MRVEFVGPHWWKASALTTAPFLHPWKLDVNKYGFFPQLDLKYYNQNATEFVCVVSACAFVARVNHSFISLIYTSEAHLQIRRLFCLPFFEFLQSK